VKKRTLLLLIIVLAFIIVNVIIFRTPLSLWNPFNGQNNNESPATYESTPTRAGMLSSIPGGQIGQSYQSRMQASGNSVLTTGNYVVRTISISLLAKDTAKAFADISHLTLQYNGTIQYSSITGDQAANRKASMTLSVPENQTAAVMEAIHHLNVTIESETTTAQNVTANYIDIRSRLNAAAAVEAQYLQILKNSKAIPDVVTVTDKLSETRANIESLKSQLNLLNQQTNYTSITISIYAAPMPVNESWTTLGEAMNAYQFLLTTLEWLGIAGIWFVIYILPLGVLFTLVYFIVRFFVPKRFLDKS
jgi:hypothetical protein